MATLTAVNRRLSRFVHISEVTDSLFRARAAPLPPAKRIPKSEHEGRVGMKSQQPPRMRTVSSSGLQRSGQHCLHWSSTDRPTRGEQSTAVRIHARWSGTPSGLFGLLLIALAAVILATSKPPLLPAIFVIVAIAIRVGAGAQYTWGVYKGRARPNAVTWLLWGITPLIAFVAQIHHGAGPESAVTLVLAIGPLVVAGVTVLRDRTASQLTPLTTTCAAFAVVGLILWQVTKNPVLAIAFCIIADAFATVPTLAKAYRDPRSEYATPYYLSVSSMVVTLYAVETWTFTTYAFPLYMLIINVILFVFATFPLSAELEQVHARFSHSDRLLEK
jgi:hypothetical protein